MLIRDATLAIDGKLWVEIMGSYRRGAASSGDVDILITRDPSDSITHVGVLKRLVETLRRNGVITHDVRPLCLRLAYGGSPSRMITSPSRPSGWALAACQAASTAASISSPSPLRTGEQRSSTSLATRW